MKDSIAIIVLNWNGRDLTLACLESLTGLDAESVHILVVDNGSTDDSVAHISEQYPDIPLLVLDENLGFSAGNNAGFQKAMELWEPEYCLFLNNDTVVDSNFINPLRRALAKRKKVMVVPKIYYHNEKDILWYAGGFVNLWIGNVWHQGIREQDKGQYDREKTVDYATGCCIALRATEFKRLGGFDTSFAMYAEDVDLSLRFRDSGGSIYYVPEAKIWHKVSSSVGGAMSPGKIIKRFKGHFRFLAKHARWYHWPTIICYLPIQIILSVIKYFTLR